MPAEDGWKSQGAAERYTKVIDFIVPGRRDILDIIAQLVTRPKTGKVQDGSLKILDLGCGNGEVTAEILKHNGTTSVCMVDYSDEMVLLSKDRFASCDRIRVMQHDLNEGLPEAVLTDRFDTVVSCFSFHHIEFDRRVKLYADICQVLKPGSLLVIGDMFRCDSPTMNEWEFDNWVRWMVVNMKEHLGEEHSFDEIKERQLKSFERMGDKPGTVWDMQNDLKAAGFNKVDCMYKRLNLAVIVAEK